MEKLHPLQQYVKFLVNLTKTLQRLYNTHHFKLSNIQSSYLKIEILLFFRL